MFEFLDSTEKKMGHVLDLSWEVLFRRILSGRIQINKESSMQLHYSSIIHELGELLCLSPSEAFAIELEHSINDKNIDVICSYDSIKAAIELKCFRKDSNRAKDTDMYDALKDIERLLTLEDFAVKRFICLTDNQYYAKGEHSGHAGSVSIKDKKRFAKGDVIHPSWTGKWKDTARDRDIVIDKDVQLNWVERSGWFYMSIDL